VLTLGSIVPKLPARIIPQPGCDFPQLSQVAQRVAAIVIGQIPFNSLHLEPQSTK
jgi:hypothetical protein